MKSDYIVIIPVDGGYLGCSIDEIVKTHVNMDKRENGKPNLIIENRRKNNGKKKHIGSL